MQKAIVVGIYPLDRRVDYTRPGYEEYGSDVKIFQFFFGGQRLAERIASWILALAATYLAAGVLFALTFLFRGLERVDPAAQGARWGFRCLIAPGVVALWPLLARRWWLVARAPGETGS